MRYLIDANSLSSDLLGYAKGHRNFYVIEDVIDEMRGSDGAQKIRAADIKTIHITKKHIDKLYEILEAHGKNLRLIRLFTNKGAADVLMLAVALADGDGQIRMFDDHDWTIVTRDKGLIETAGKYGIACLPASGLMSAQ